jgi:hypothetical protein
MTGVRHLAHFNWATLRAPLGDPLVAPFENAAPKVNALAERSPGFVWRSGEEAELACQAGWPMFLDDARLIASFSVWETPQDLQGYVYKTVHGAFFKRAEEWFDATKTRGHVLWWVPVGHIPTIDEAREKVEALAAHGPSQGAFTFAEVAAAD